MTLSLSPSPGQRERALNHEGDRTAPPGSREDAAARLGSSQDQPLNRVLRGPVGHGAGEYLPGGLMEAGGSSPSGGLRGPRGYVGKGGNPAVASREGRQLKRRLQEGRLVPSWDVPAGPGQDRLCHEVAASAQAGGRSQPGGAAPAAALPLPARWHRPADCTWQRPRRRGGFAGRRGTGRRRRRRTEGASAGKRPLCRPAPRVPEGAERNLPVLWESTRLLLASSFLLFGV